VYSCDNCRVRTFDTFDEALAHEKFCEGHVIKTLTKGVRPSWFERSICTNEDKLDQATKEIREHLLSVGGLVCRYQKDKRVEKKCHCLLPLSPNAVDGPEKAACRRADLEVVLLDFCCSDKWENDEHILSIVRDAEGKYGKKLAGATYNLMITPKSMQLSPEEAKLYKDEEPMCVCRDALMAVFSLGPHRLRSIRKRSLQA